MAEVEYTGFGSRLGKSCVGMIVGPILFLASFPLLFMNEGCAVHRAQTLAAGRESVVEVSADKVDNANDKKLVHLTGEATSTETLSDPTFGIAEKNTIKLTRTVEIYQWKETVESKTQKQVGGREVTTRTYHHKKEWVKEPIPSNDFKPDDDGKSQNEIQNVGTLTYQNKEEKAKVVKLGAFTLTDSQVQRMGAGEKLPATKELLAAAEGAGKSNLEVRDGNFYIPYGKTRPTDDPGKDNPFLPSPEDNPFLPSQPGPDKNVDANSGSSEPRIGDQRISFMVLKPATVSVLARQLNGSFDPWPAPGGQGTIDEFKVGTASAEQMIAAAEAANVVTTWILRIVGYLMMAVGIFLVGQPFATFADILPMLGDFVSAAIAVLAAIIALPLTLIVISIGWVFYRPLIGVPILIVGLLGLGGIVYLVVSRMKGRKSDVGGRWGDREARDDRRSHRDDSGIKDDRGIRDDPGRRDDR